MRLWVREADRRPNPPVAKTDDRLAVHVGLGLWVLALGLTLLLGPALPAATHDVPVTATCLTGIALGLLGLIYLRRRR